MLNIIKLLRHVFAIAIIAVVFIGCKDTDEPKDNPGLPVLTGTVVITGNVQVGQTLTAVPQLNGTGDISYLWRSETADVGENSPNYIPQNSDIDKTITVTVTRSGMSGSITSDPTAKVVDLAAPTPGLAFTLINNGTAYSVSKGTATASYVVIPATYEGLPVVEIADSGFSSYENLTSVVIS